MDLALTRAVALCDDAGAFKRGSWGLMGIWGPLIRSWLDELLPADADERTRGRVSLLVNKPLVSVPALALFGTTLSRLGHPCVERLAVTDFVSRDELIDAAMASVHIPLFLDGKSASTFRGAPCIDGSFAWAGPPPQYALPAPHQLLPTVRVSPMRDPRMRERYGRMSDFLRLGSTATVREMMSWGEAHVEVMERAGQLEMLPAR